MRYFVIMTDHEKIDAVKRHSRMIRPGTVDCWKAYTSPPPPETARRAQFGKSIAGMGKRLVSASGRYVKTKARENILSFLQRLNAGEVGDGSGNAGCRLCAVHYALDKPLRRACERWEPGLATHGASRADDRLAGRSR